MPSINGMTLHHQDEGKEKTKRAHDGDHRTYIGAGREMVER
jgi:hypothetical protein